MIINTYRLFQNQFKLRWKDSSEWDGRESLNRREGISEWDGRMTLNETEERPWMSREDSSEWDGRESLNRREGISEWGGKMSLDEMGDGSGWDGRAALKEMGGWLWMRWEDGSEWDVRASLSETGGRLHFHQVFRDAIETPARLWDARVSQFWDIRASHNFRDASETPSTFDEIPGHLGDEMPGSLEIFEMPLRCLGDAYEMPVRLKFETPAYLKIFEMPLRFRDASASQFWDTRTPQNFRDTFETPAHLTIFLSVYTYIIWNWIWVKNNF